MMLTSEPLLVAGAATLLREALQVHYLVTHTVYYSCLIFFYLNRKKEMKKKVCENKTTVQQAPYMKGAPRSKELPA